MNVSVLFSRNHRRPAFTLVELLVVTGIVALLISLLLPALGKARKQAYLVTCESNMRQIGMACVQHANEHRGYMPYAGPLLDPTSGNNDTPTPSNLKDPAQNKYDYYNHTPSNVGIMVMPIEAALAPIVGNPVRTDTMGNMCADIGVNNTGGSPNGPISGAGAWPTVRKIFTCPTDNSYESGVFPYGIMPSADTPSGPDYAQYTSYAYNLNIFGLSTNQNSGLGHSYTYTWGYARAGGNISQVPFASETVLMTEMALANGTNDPFVFGDSPGLTLYDAMTCSPGGHPWSTAAGDTNIFSQMNFRHDTVMNVLFVDGHVEALGIPRIIVDSSFNIVPASMVNAPNSGDLKRAYLWKAQ